MTELDLRFPLLDTGRLGPASELARSYRAAQPFPHVVIDDFLEPWLLDEVIDRFPDDRQPMHRVPRTAALDDGRIVQSGKRNYAEGEVDPLINLLFWQLNSGPFLQFLEHLSGIRALICDPLLKGGGLHITDPGGLLAVHADFNKHPVYGLDRRINLLLYLNRDWSADYGGELELWDRELTACQRRIAPVANRCVIFNTSSTSFHGHPEALKTPAGVSRRSLAMYYYSNGRPGDEATERHATLWPVLPN